MEVAVVVVLTILVVIFIAYLVLVSGPALAPLRPSGGVKEERELPTDFKVYNYLPNTALKVSVALQDGTTKVLIPNLPAKGIKGLTKQQVSTYLAPGNVLSFEMANGLPFADYTINTEEHTRIKALRVGMVTTRYIGSTDYLRMATPAANAGGGMPWVKIHNLTYQPLTFNEGQIRVNPHDVTRFQGYLHQGVPLGSWFVNDQQLFPVFQYLKPQSDLYYGVVSDLEQPIQGCWQLEFSDLCEYGQTLWPFNDGIIH